MSLDGKLLDKTGVQELNSYIFGVSTVGYPVPIKFGFQNTKTNVVSPGISFIQTYESDMYEFMRTVIDTVTISCPFNVACDVTSFIHSLTANTYYYCFNSYIGTLTTGPSLEVVVGVTTPGLAPIISCSTLLGITGYKLYRSTSPGIYTDCLVTTIGTTSAVTFTDVGSATLSGSPPDENNTGGASPNYGTSPTTGFGTLGILAGVAYGQQKFFWVEVSPTSSATEAVNPRTCNIRISEVF